MRDKDYDNIRGAGGSKGKGQRAPVEADDNLRSKQIARIIDAICEGPIVGLINGERSVYINETPLMNADGTRNFKDVFLPPMKEGTQSQTPFEGVSDVEFEVGVNEEIRQEFPVTRTIVNPTIQAIRVTIATPALTSTDTKTGDINGTRVEYEIYVQTDQAGFVLAVSDFIDGKTTSRYQRSYTIRLTGTGPWDVRVVRKTPDSDSLNLVNELYWDSYTGITDAKLSYPNTALVYTKINAEEFNSLPNRGYGIKGLIVRVPTNYDPSTRTYNGIWDGTFKPAWTDNPAWCFYDIIVSNRYGLGDLVDINSVDKWALYSIAQYCDQLVYDGFGRQEPRFTCNLYLQTREEAYKVLQNMASIFRGMSFWAAGSIFTMQDRPADPIALFTNANVIDGEFRYVGSSIKQRHTIALVTWNDPLDFYKQKIEYVQDDNGIKQYGPIQTDVVAFGCASRGQANRLGEWILALEKLSDETIEFKTGLEGAAVYPGAIITTSDINRAGIRMGGRIVSATQNSVLLDAPVEILAGKAYSLQIIDTEGNVHTSPVQANVGNVVSLTLAAPFSAVPINGAVFILTANDLFPELWRVVGVSEDDEGTTVNISAMKYEPGIYDNIESGKLLQPRPISRINGKPDTPANLNVFVSRYVLDGQLAGLKATLSWSGASPRYQVRYRRANGPWVPLPEVFDSSVDILNVEYDNYTFEVYAINTIGVVSNTAVLNAFLQPGAVKLDTPTNLMLEGPFTADSAKFIWDKVSGATDYEITIESITGPLTERLRTIVRLQNIGNVTRYEYGVTDMKADGGPYREINFKVRALGAYGSSGDHAELQIGNPQVAPLNLVTVTSGIRTLFFECEKPTDDDYRGIEIHMSTESEFTPSAESLIHDGSFNFYVIKEFKGLPLDPKVKYYLKAAGYDAFGRDNMNFGGTILGTASANAPDLDTITRDMVTAGALDITKFADDIEPVGIVDILPNPQGYTGTRIVFLTTDGKIYRLVNGVWTNKTLVEDLEGALDLTVLDGSIDVTKLDASLTSQIAKINETATGLLAEAETRGAEITTERTTRQTQFDSLAEQTLDLTTSNDIAQAALRLSMTVKSVADMSISQDVSEQAVQNEIARAALKVISTAKTVGDTSLAQTVTILSAQTQDDIAAAVQQVTTAYTTQDSALASQITNLSARLDSGDIGSFEPFQTWEFANTIDGWTVSGATATPGSFFLTLDSTSTDPILRSPAVSIDGAKFHRIRMRVRRDQGTTWDGNLYYTTAAHPEGAAYRALIPDSLVEGNYTILEWDMSKLAAGGTDWTTSTITGFAIHLGASALDDFTIDWISVGRIGTGVSFAAIEEERVARVAADGSLASRIDTLTSALNGNQVAIQQIATTSNGVFGQVSVKIDNNKHITGYSLTSSTGPEGEPTSAMVFKVDRFAIVGTGANPVAPFEVYTKDNLQYVGIAGTTIIDGTITAGKVAVGAISAAQISAGAITADKLYVTSQGPALNVDRYFADESAWKGAESLNASFVSIQDGRVGKTAVRTTAGLVGTIAESKEIPIDLRKTYLVEGWIRRSLDANGTAFVGVAIKDNLGNNIPFPNGSNFWYVAANAMTLANTEWTRVIGYINGETLLPENATSMRPIARLNFGGTAGFYEIQDLRVEQVLLGTSISAGAITTDKIAASAITADKILVNAITADKIAANAITADKISAGAITASKIAAGAITADLITVGFGGRNLLINSEPSRLSTAGFVIGYNTTGRSPNSNIAGEPVAPSFDPWRPTGSGGAFFAFSSFTPPANSVCDLVNRNHGARYSVIGGKRYEASVYLSMHRCTGDIAILFFNASNQQVGEFHGNRVTIQAAQGSLSEWPRSVVFCTAPSTAVTAEVFVRSYYSGAAGTNDPHTFASLWYFGPATDVQEEFSVWGPSGNNTVIDGDTITAGSIHGNRITFGTLTGDRIAANTIDGNRIIANSLRINGNAEIFDASIGTLKVGGEAITTVRQFYDPNGIQLTTSTTDRTTYAEVQVTVTQAMGSVPINVESCCRLLNHQAVAIENVRAQTVLEAIDPSGNRRILFSEGWSGTVTAFSCGKMSGGVIAYPGVWTFRATGNGFPMSAFQRTLKATVCQR